MNKKFIIISLVCIVLIGGFLRFYKLGDSAFDRDEFFELNSSYGYFKTGNWLAWDFNNQKTFPMEMQDDTSNERAEVFRWQLAQLYRIWEPSETLTRGLGVFWGVIGIALVYFVAISFTGNAYIGLIAAFLTAIGYSEILYSRRLRMYAIFFPAYLAFSWSVFKFYESKYKGKINFLKKLYEKTGFNFSYFFAIIVLGLISANIHILSAHIFATLAFYSGLFLFITLYKKQLSWKSFYLNKYFLTTLATLSVLIIYNLPILNSLHKLIKKNFKFFLAKPNYDIFNQYFYDFSYPLIGLALFLIGTWYLSKKINRMKEAAFLFFSAAIPLLFAIFTWRRDVSHRYIYFLQSFGIILSAIGIYGIIFLLSEKIKRYKKPIILVLLIVFLFGIDFNYFRSGEIYVKKANSYYPNFKTVFNFVEKNKKTGDVLVTRTYRSFYWRGDHIKTYDIKNLEFGAKNCQEKIQKIISENPSGIIVYAKIDAITQCSQGLKYYEENLTRLKDPQIPSSVLIYRWDK